MNSAHDANFNAQRHPDRLLFVGGGDLGVKMLQVLNQSLETGTEVHVADVEDAPKLIQHGFQPTKFYNIRRRDSLCELQRVGLRRPFDLAYVASLPAAHFENILMLRTIANRIVVTKPSTDFAHYGAMKALVDNPIHSWFLDAVDEHDHYLTKPVTMAIRSILSQALAECGRFRRMRVFLTERKQIMEEEGRLDALRVGQLPDMGSHAVALIQGVTCEGETWTRSDGLRITRLNRTIKVTACVEFQANGAIALGPHSSSAVIAELQVNEKLRAEYDTRVEETHNVFHVLLVCGKSLTVDPSTDSDLKALEIEFNDGTTGALDLERNAVRGVFHTLLGANGVPERHHRGINLGLQKVFCHWQSFIADPQQRLRKTLFQQSTGLWEKLSILWHAWQLSGEGKKLVGVRDRRPIQDLVNICAVPENGFKSGWRMTTPPSDLIFGALPIHEVK